MLSRNQTVPRAGAMPPGLVVLAAFLSLTLIGCWGKGDASMEDGPDPSEPVALGPKDGFDLPPTDLDRVAVGAPAPDFSLRTIHGDTLTLSAFRGVKNVVLVFYRGHW